MNKKAFADYVWSFYGPSEMYGHFFGQDLRRTEMQAALALFHSKETDPAYDTFDRERVRDILFKMRGVQNTEYDVSNFFE